MRFNLNHHNAKARQTTFTLKHGKVETPAFMPVGTYGAIKGLNPQQVKQVGSQIILSNTLHLFLRSDVDLVEQMGGLHLFIGWDKPILTDSGGFQIFSLKAK